MKTLTVDCTGKSYPIHIGRGLLSDLDKYLPPGGGRRIVVTDDTVAAQYLEPVCAAAGVAAGDAIVFASGEQSKTLATCEEIYSGLLERAVARDALLLALGGGVVGDMAGFVAATYLRGVAFAQLPTTLLAQVDSAVGGKTAVNHPLGKNMIGAFYQPECVVADLDALKTLPAQHFTAALAEIIKYGLITDAGFFAWLEENLDALVRHEEQALVHAVHRSCEIKAGVVAQDEFEQSGLRALLNLGHTFGHALETHLGYGHWLHGEAVGCGLALAARLSARCGLIGAADVARIVTLLERAGLPTAVPAGTDAAAVLEAMRRDKKNLGARRRFVLLKSIGSAFISDDVAADDVAQVLAR